MIFQYQILIWFKPKTLVFALFVILCLYTLLNNTALIFSWAYPVFCFSSGSDISTYQMRLYTTSFKSVMNMKDFDRI